MSTPARERTPAGVGQLRILNDVASSTFPVRLRMAAQSPDSSLYRGRGSQVSDVRAVPGPVPCPAIPGRLAGRGDANALTGNVYRVDPAGVANSRVRALLDAIGVGCDGAPGCSDPEAGAPCKACSAGEALDALTTRALASDWGRCQRHDTAHPRYPGGVCVCVSRSLTQAPDPVSTYPLDAVRLAGADALARGLDATPPDATPYRRALHATIAQRAAMGARLLAGGLSPDATADAIAAARSQTYSPRDGRAAGSLSRSPGAPWGPWATGPDATPESSATRLESVQGKRRTHGAGVAMGRPSARGKARAQLRASSDATSHAAAFDARRDRTPDADASEVSRGLASLTMDYQGCATRRARVAVLRRVTAFARVVGVDPATARAAVTGEAHTR